MEQRQLKLHVRKRHLDKATEKAVSHKRKSVSTLPTADLPLSASEKPSSLAIPSDNEKVDDKNSDLSSSLPVSTRPKRSTRTTRSTRSTRSDTKAPQTSLKQTKLQGHFEPVPLQQDTTTKSSPSSDTSTELCTSEETHDTSGQAVDRKDAEQSTPTIKESQSSSVDTENDQPASNLDAKARAHTDQTGHKRPPDTVPTTSHAKRQCTRSSILISPARDLPPSQDTQARVHTSEPSTPDVPVTPPASQGTSFDDENDSSHLTPSSVVETESAPSTLERPASQWPPRKERVAEETKTLTKLRDALDISLMFHAGHNRTAYFHKIQTMLCHSTQKNITLVHVSKIMFLAPELYLVVPHILKDFGRTLEAYMLSFGTDWHVPLSGKDVEKRETILTTRLTAYFEAHPEPTATIPEQPLPKIEKVVDKDAWLRNAKLPPGVRSLLELQESRRQEAKEEQTTPQLKPTGTVRQRAGALLDRIRAKQQQKKSST